VTHVDVDDHATVADNLLIELTTANPEIDVALRQGQRFLRTYRPAPIARTEDGLELSEQPVVMITGGLGHMGLALAESAYSALGARLVLVGRTALPDPERWLEEADAPDRGEQERAVLRRLATMRMERDEVLVVSADLRDADEVHAAVDAACERFGKVDVVVHGAANVGASAFGPVVETGRSVVDNQISPKVHGLEALIEALEGREPARWIVHSSISSVLGGLGLAAYAGANAVLDSMATRGGAKWLSIGWDAWDNAAEAQMSGVAAIQPAEGQDAFLRLLRSDVGTHVLVAVGDLDNRIESWVRRSKPAGSAGSGKRHPRPSLASPYVEPASDTESAMAYIWASQLGLEKVGVHDRFFDLGGHSLLAVQVASEIRDRFQIEMPVLQIFNAPTVRELSAVVERATLTGGVIEVADADHDDDGSLGAEPAKVVGGAIEGPGAAAKASYREFYDNVTRRLQATGVGEASFFLNYGYVSSGREDEAVREVPEDVPNRNSVRLALELVGRTELAGRDVLDVGCGRGGTASLLAEEFGAMTVGVDLSPEAIAFCRTAHRANGVKFEVGDAEHLPFDDASFDVVTNLESSHTYPDMRAFLNEVARVLRSNGWFLHTDLLPPQRWAEVSAILAARGFTTVVDREITAHVLASCNEVALTRTGAFGARDETMDNFLAIPGSPVYEQMASGSWEYRIVRSRLRP
jgi:SAM-dependent methyltransferase/NAD(P)-dependent dehydrogenase (short-subunit alcohol dehydrogenase family)